MIQAKAPLQNDGVKFVEIPKGWKRILENGSIHYISPSSSDLNSYEHVIDYLKKDGTCKCGLDCPFHVHRVFNFDTTVQNKELADNVVSIKSHSSTCKLCDSNWQNEKNLVDSRFLQKPLNQTLKQSGKKPVQFSFDGSLNKKVANRSRTKLSDGPKAKRPRKVSSPLSDIPSPPPIPISSPVQNVPNNLGALNQGPLPSFASIVSSSKFFNPGPNRGPLQPIGSLPLQGNNKFAFPRILTPDISKSVTATSSNTTVVNTTSIPIAYTTAPITTMTKSAVAKAALLKGVMTSTASVTNTVVQNVVSTSVLAITNTTSQMDKKPVVMETFSSSANSLSTVTSHNNSTAVSCSSNVLPNLVSNAVCLVKTISSPTITSNKAVIMPIISTPTLPSVFAPLDGVSTDVVKSKPPPKAKSRSRPSRAKSSKSKAEVKLDDKSKLVKMAGSTVASASSSRPIPSHWPLSASHVPYQTANTTIALSNASSVVSTHSTDSLPLSRPVVPQIAMPSSIYMTANYQNHGQAMKISSPPAVSPLNQNTSSGGSGKDGSTSAPIATSSSTYPVVATPRIQAPPGMMYVAAAPGVGMFSPAYSYTAGGQPLQITQAPVSQQNKTAATTTAATTSSQQPVTQGMKSETTQGQISFQVPSMYVQGSNQMFPINPQGFGVNQYKAPYQLQNAVYPNTGNTMTFITPNGAKAAYPGLQTVGNIGQFAYPNPYMFGIVMPTTTNQQTTSTSTPSSPVTPTSVTTSLHMLQPQTLQNPAVAAAFDSFVPIAPAAGGSTPRFAQTLAHLASAYNTFPQTGLVQGGNHLQLAYQMMHMNPHGNVQQIANLGGLGPADAKHPVGSSVKQASSDSAKCVGNSKSKAPQSPLSNSPHTPVTQDYGGPFTSSHTSNSLTTTTSTSISMSQLQQPPGLCQKPQENLTTTSVCTSESKNSPIRMPDLKCKDTSSESLRHESNREWENAIGSPKSNSLCGAINTNGPKATDDATSPPHCKASPPAKQKSTALSDVGVCKQNTSLETESVKFQQQAVNDNQSPVRTTDEPNTRFSIQSPGQANSHCPRQDFQSHPNSTGTRAGAVTAKSNSPTKTIDNREPKRSPKFVEKVNYYETNPLLGMKRSCEAIEVYPDPPENLADEDKEDYYSSNESPEGNDATSECTLDLRHGDSSNMEDALRPGAQMQNVGKGVHNGGCNAVNNEQDAFLGSRVKTNVEAEPYQPDGYGDLTIANIKPHFDTGDVVWAQARGLPSWPGKIVDENKVGKGKADDGKKWVMWFGDHTFSQVEVDRLKTLNEGLRSLDDKARKKKYRAKKARISLEQAITEALEELEMREQIKSRQGVKSKAKKKRLR